jgi:uncharacterized protein YbjT (DUF2867 family)
MVMTTIALFGATGKTGRHVLREALESGHSVRALARQRSALGPDSALLTVVEGDVLDADAVDQVVAGSDVVISVFGQVKGSPPTLQTDGTANIVRAMQVHGVPRIVSLSGGGLPFSKDQPKVADRLVRLLLKALSPQVLKDAHGHLEVLRGSGLDWTVVRGPVLTDTPGTGVYRVGWVGVNASMKIGRADLAHFILIQAHDKTYIEQMPFVSY